MLNNFSLMNVTKYFVITGSYFSSYIQVRNSQVKATINVAAVSCNKITVAFTFFLETILLNQLHKIQRDEYKCRTGKDVANHRYVVLTK